MKPKKFSRKLELNKKTVADLNSQAMQRIRGGEVTIEGETCPIAECPIKSVVVCLESRIRPCV